MADFTKINVSIWGVKDGFNANIFSSNNIPEVSSTFTDSTRLLSEANTSIFFCIEHTKNYSIITLIDPNCTDFVGRTAFLAFSLILDKAYHFTSSPLKCLMAIRDFYLKVQSPSEKLNRFTPNQILALLVDTSVTQGTSQSYNSQGFCFSSNESEIDEYLRLSKNYFSFQKAYFFNPSSNLQEGTNNALKGFKRFEIKEIEQKESNRLQSIQNELQKRRNECKHVESLINSKEFEEAARVYKKLKDNQYVGKDYINLLNTGLNEIKERNIAKQKEHEKNQDLKNIERIITLYSQGNPTGAIDIYNGLKDKNLFKNKNHDLLQQIKSDDQTLKSEARKEKLENEKVAFAERKKKKKKSLLIISILVLLIGTTAGYFLLFNNNVKSPKEGIEGDGEMQNDIVIDSSNVDHDNFIASKDACPNLYGSDSTGCPNCELDGLINKVDNFWVQIHPLKDTLKNDILFSWNESHNLYDKWVKIKDSTSWIYTGDTTNTINSIKTDSSVIQLNKYFHKNILTPAQKAEAEAKEEAEAIAKKEAEIKAEAEAKEEAEAKAKEEAEIKAEAESQPDTEVEEKVEEVEETDSEKEEETDSEEVLNEKCNDEFETLKVLHAKSMESEKISTSDLNKFIEFTKGDCLYCNRSATYMNKINDLIKELKPLNN